MMKIFISFFTLAIISHFITFSFSIYPPDTITKIKYDTVKVEKVVLVYDTVKVYDTIFHFDTIFIEKPLVNSFGISFSLGQPYEFILSNAVETENIVSTIKSSEYGRLSVGFSLNYKHYFGKWDFQIGLGVINFNKNANYNFLKTVINSSTQIDTTDNSYWQVTVIDTFYEVSGTDTIPHIVADSTWVPAYEVDTVTNYDTTDKNIIYKGKNRFTFVRIPIVLEYQLFVNNNWSLNLGAGIVVGILTGTSGKTLSEQNEISLLEDFMPVRTNLFLHSDLNLSYNISDQFRFSVGIGGEYMLKSFFKLEKNITRKLLYYNMKVGFEYLF